MAAPAPVLYAGAVIFLAAFVHGLTGFGAALVAMPLLSHALNVRLVSPLVALLTLAVNLFLLFRGRRAASPARIAPLAAGALAGVPLGALFLARAPEQAVTSFLGIFLVLYALYALFGAPPPALGKRAGILLGLFSGAMGGAFNTGGPPAVVYVSSQRWGTGEMHAALQLYFCLTGLLVVSSHALAGLTTPVVLRWCLLMLPPLLAGGAAGFSLHRRVEPARYRRLLWVSLLLLGATMLWR